MPERDVDLDTTKGEAKPQTIQADETREQKKARRAQVYDRGVLGDRLHVDLPPHLYGEWVPNNVMSRHQKEGFGFRVDTEYAKQRKLHDQGTDESIVGDVVFMVCDREDKEILDEIRKERYEAVHGTKGGKQKEERDFVGTADPITAPKADSNVRVAKPSDISSSIKAATKTP